MYGRVVGSVTELRGFLREAVGEVYRYALALTVSPERAEQLTASATLRLARHVDAVGAAPVSAARLNLVVRREVLDGLPHRRRARRRRGSQPARSATEPATPITSALAALASLDVEERIALVLRHHDGLLLPDVAAALGVPYPEAEQVLARARERLAGVIATFDDGSGADPYGRLVRAVPGPPDALADRIWIAVDAALVPDYADSEAWRVPDLLDGDDLGWEGFNAVPVDEPRVPPAQEARRVGTTLLIGAAALAVVLAVAALTAPKDDDGGATATVPSTVPRTVPPSSTVEQPAVPSSGGARPVGRSALPPAAPDLVIDAARATPHVPDSSAPLDADVTFSAPDVPADVWASTRRSGEGSRIVVRRVADDGTSEAWLISVAGEVRNARPGEPELLHVWPVEMGAIVALQVAGDPDQRVLVGLRSGGGGTWIRLPDTAEALTAQPDGSVLCSDRSPAGPTLDTYQLLR